MGFQKSVNQIALQEFRPGIRSTADIVNRDNIMKYNRKILVPQCNSVVEYKKDSKGRWIGMILGGTQGMNENN